MTWVIIVCVILLVMGFIGSYQRYRDDPEYRKLCDSEMRNYEKRKKL